MAYSIYNGTTTVPLNEKDNVTYGSPQIQSMKRSTESQTWEILIPTSGPETAIVLDLMGTKRIITISGISTGEVTKLDAFTNALEGFMNSNQFSIAQTSPTGTGLRFVADRPASTAINVIMKSFEWEYVAGNVNKIEWNMSLMQGNT